MRKRKMSTLERLNKGLLNRNERRKPAGKVTVSDPELTVTNPNAAGIDVGNESHFAAVPPDRDPHPVREFGCWTAALKEMAEWLARCHIDTVVMQSTGVYWIPLYDILEQHGLRVVVVNARDTRNMPGRKTDVQECQADRRMRPQNPDLSDRPAQTDPGKICRAGHRRVAGAEEKEAVQEKRQRAAHGSERGTGTDLRI